MYHEPSNWTSRSHTVTNEVALMRSQLAPFGNPPLAKQGIAGFSNVRSEDTFQFSYK
jgi:hypothetical protein